MSLKEIKGDLSKWKDILCLWIGRLTIVKMAVLPKLMYRSDLICIKIKTGFFFYRNWQTDHKSHIDMKETHNSHNNLEKNSTFLNFKIYYKAKIIIIM